MKHTCIGVLAHVDAGKTTLLEALLYHAGVIRRLGRVDHKDAFFDTDIQERERGITIFSKQAELAFPEGKMMLLDTPGHVDFSAEMERTLQVLDYAVLVINGKDGIQGHTMTLWKLLKKYHVPVFLFLNKMDLDGTNRGNLMAALQQTFGDGCIDFSAENGPDEDALSMCSEEMMEEVLTRAELSDSTVLRGIAARQVFPCYFGSALKLQGVEFFLQDLCRWTLRTERLTDSKKIQGKDNDDAESAFGARVFKITRDAKGMRLTHMKITSGSLKAKELLNGEKAEQLRVYSGENFRMVPEAETGSICAVTGLTKTFAGQGLGNERQVVEALIEPIMSYRLLLEEGTDAYRAYAQLKLLEEEDPQLRITWNEQSRQIHLQLMGEVQLQVLQNLIKARFGLSVTFGQGSIAYRETLAAPVIGSGHFEPLRHYAEVHLLMEPGPRGSGVMIDTACSTDALDLNWQRLIWTHILEREHPGTLLGLPVTDLRITILAGRAHKKHTEGGDFRQATFRAIRQGLRKARAQGICTLLEPWYDFQLEVPAECVGRAMADLQRMSAVYESPQLSEETAVLKGKAPAAELKEYPTVLSAYTKGFGRLTYTMRGFEECHNTEDVLSRSDYDPDADAEHPSASVFCQQGAGVIIPWNETEGFFHLSVSLPETEQSGSVLSNASGGGGAAFGDGRRNNGVGMSGTYMGSREEDADLKRIFERTYGAGSSEGNRHAARREAVRIDAVPQYRPTKPLVKLPEYIFVDGYNLIFAWDELKELAKINLDSAREALLDRLVNYQGYRNCRMTVVFDAYRIRGGVRHEERRGGVDVVFTKEDETADTYIERTTYGMEKNYLVRVVSSDRLEQQMVLASSALRVSATEFQVEFAAVQKEIGAILEKNAGKVQQATRRGIHIPKPSEEQ